MKLPVIDFLRGYSIFTIVVFHLCQWLPIKGLLAKAIYFGGAGVHVFVLCSGFGLCLSQLKKPLPFLPFLKKRLLKIYVPYILVVLISAPIPFLYDHNDRLMALLSHVFCFKMFHEPWMTSFGYPLWFISMILQFYLLFHILFYLVKRFRWSFVLLSLIISVCWSTYVGLSGRAEIRIWNSFFLQFLWEFALGMMLAIRYTEQPSILKMPSTRILAVLAVLGITLVGISGLRGGAWKLYNDIPSLVGYLSLALLLFQLGGRLDWIRQIFLTINRFSYELYLVHGLVMLVVFRLTAGFMPVLLQGLLALALSVVCAIAYHGLLRRYFYPRV